MDTNNCFINDIRAIQGYGLRTIMASSTQHFAIMRTQVGFYKSYPPNLRTILLDFLEQSLPLMGMDIPFRGKFAKPYNEAALLMIWNDLLLKLDSIDCRHCICRWISLVNENDKQFRNEFPISKWNKLLIDFATENKPIPELPTNIDKIKDIKINIMRYRIERLEFRLRHVIDEEDYDEWEEYLIKQRKVDAWLMNRMTLYKDLELFRTILIDILTAEEVSILDSLWQDLLFVEYKRMSMSDLRMKLLSIDTFLD